MLTVGEDSAATVFNVLFGTGRTLSVIMQLWLPPHIPAGQTPLCPSVIMQLWLPGHITAGQASPFWCRSCRNGCPAGTRLGSPWGIMRGTWTPYVGNRPTTAA